MASNFNFIPGSGGDVVAFNHTELPIVDGTFIQFHLNDADGFVEIVSSNCGCAGQCVVYREEGEFECTCPNGTLLADDGSSCYRG